MANVVGVVLKEQVVVSVGGFNRVGEIATFKARLKVEGRARGQVSGPARLPLGLRVQQPLGTQVETLL